jgi:hypothetical protein
LNEDEEAWNVTAGKPGEFIGFGPAVDEPPSRSSTIFVAEKFCCGKSFGGHCSIVAHQVKMGILICFHPEKRRFLDV